VRRASHTAAASVASAVGGGDGGATLILPSDDSGLIVVARLNLFRIIEGRTMLVLDDFGLLFSFGACNASGARRKE
jgi:hypothetical protein